MELLTQSLKGTLETSFKNGLKTANKVLVCSPFLTPAGTDMMEHWLKYKNVDIDYITNVSDLNLVISYQSPIDNLLYLLKEYPNKLRIYNHGTVHAKAYIIPDKIAFAGSSNLTQAGMTDNEELNFSIKNNKQDQVAFKQIVEWFESLKNASRPVDETELRRLKAAWEKFRKTIKLPKGIMGDGCAIDLGVSSWQKVLLIAKHSTIKRTKLKNILTDKSDIKKSYLKSKIQLLTRLGFINGPADGPWMVDQKQIARIDKSALQLWNMLEMRIQGLKTLIAHLAQNPKSSFKKEELFKLPRIPHSHIDAGINWMHEMGLVAKNTIEGEGHFLFYSITKNGLNFHKRIYRE